VRRCSRIWLGDWLVQWIYTVIQQAGLRMPLYLIAEQRPRINKSSEYAFCRLTIWKVIPLYSLVANSERHASAEFDSWIKPNVRNHVSENRGVVIRHFTLFFDQLQHTKQRKELPSSQTVLYPSQAEVVTIVQPTVTVLDSLISISSGGCRWIAITLDNSILKLKACMICERTK